MGGDLQLDASFFAAVGDYLNVSAVTVKIEHIRVHVEQSDLMHFHSPP
jgi:hypothetical protein